MATIPLLEVISFSTQHPVNKVSNLLKGTGKWTNPIKNVSAKGKEIAEIDVEFKLPLCKIEALDIGNCWSSSIEIEVGRSGESANSRIPLLKNPNINLMTRLDCHNGNNAEAMKFFSKDDINPQVINTFKGWDRLVIKCRQPLKNDVLFGLSTLSVRGKRLDKEIVLNLHDKSPNQIPDFDSPVKRKPEWLNPGIRASKLIENSMKNGAKRTEKENRPHFVSPQRKKLREDDDLKFLKSPKNSRNDIFVQDVTSSQNFQEKVTIRSREDFLKYSEKSLKASGVLVQVRSYKKAKKLPLTNGHELCVEAGQQVTFFKQGKIIVMVTKNRLYDPLVEPEHIRGIFKDYSSDEVMQSQDIPDLETKKCPLCMKNFNDEQKLIQHAANCQNLRQSPVKSQGSKKFIFKNKEASQTSSKNILKDELILGNVETKCPLCQKCFDDEQELMEHAANCENPRNSFDAQPSNSQKPSKKFSFKNGVKKKEEQKSPLSKKYFDIDQELTELEGNYENSRPSNNQKQSKKFSFKSDAKKKDEHTLSEKTIKDDEEITELRSNRLKFFDAQPSNSQKPSKKFSFKNDAKKKEEPKGSLSDKSFDDDFELLENASNFENSRTSFVAEPSSSQKSSKKFSFKNKKNMEHKCPLCEKSFQIEEDLIEHAANCQFSRKSLDSQPSSSQKFSFDAKKKEVYKCPLCEKNFSNEEKLIEHASNCQGPEELSQDKCPICGRDYPPENLPQHAQECAQQMFD